MAANGAAPELTRVGFGAMTFGDQVDREEGARMVRACLDAGITHFDTANSYKQGASEEVLGEVLRDVRDEVTIATKAGNPHGEGPRYQGLSRPALRAAVEDSLRRLGVDHVELFYFHLPDGTTPLEESLAAAEELRTEGKIGSLGVSNYPAWEMCQQLWIADRAGHAPLRTSQMMYNLLARRIEEEYAPFAERFDLQTVVFNPLAGGLLTGKHRRDQTSAEGRFAKSRYRERYWKDELFDAVDELQDIARDAGTTIRDLALRWVVHQPVVTTVLVGASRLEQLEENIASLTSGPLEDDVLERCDQVWEDVRGSAPRADKTRMTARS